MNVRIASAGKHAVLRQRNGRRPLLFADAISAFLTLAAYIAQALYALAAISKEWPRVAAGPTSEFTWQRKFNQASPDESSYETFPAGSVQRCVRRFGVESRMVAILFRYIGRT